MAKKISIYDVARHVNVSPAAVSYVINGINKVSEATKEKILKGIEELGYMKDYNALTLSTGKSHLIGLCLPLDDISQAMTANPFYAEFIGSLQKAIAESDYDLVIRAIGDGSAIDAWVKSRSLDALLVLGKHNEDAFSSLSSSGVPVIFCDVYSKEASSFVNIRVDDVEGERLATSYLIENGHCRIAFIGGEVETSLVDKKRLEGYKLALEEANIPYDPAIVFDTIATFEGGYSVAQDIIGKDITAICCAADIIAIGLLCRLQELGVKIPEDLSVIGFDDIATCGQIYPALTTIRQDIQEKAHLASEAVLGILQHGEVAKKTIVIAPELIVRSSVAQAK